MLESFSTGEVKAREEWQTISHTFTSLLKTNPPHFIYWRDGGRDCEVFITINSINDWFLNYYY